jgi:hypothetical protein
MDSIVNVAGVVIGPAAPVFTTTLAGAEVTVPTEFLAVNVTW